MFQNIKKCFTTWVQNMTKPLIVSLCHYCIPFTFLIWCCWGSVWFPRFCLATAKIWSGRPVLQLCYSSVLFGKQGKHILWQWGQANPKEARGSILTPFFICFSPPPEPALCKLLARKAVCFTWGSHSSSWNFLCSFFVGFFLSLSFSHYCFGLLFPILAT